MAINLYKPLFQVTAVNEIFWIQLLKEYTCTSMKTRNSIQLPLSTSAGFFFKITNHFVSAYCHSYMVLISAIPNDLALAAFFIAFCSFFMVLLQYFLLERAALTFLLWILSMQLLCMALIPLNIVTIPISQYLFMALLNTSQLLFTNTSGLHTSLKADLVHCDLGLAASHS